RDSLTMGMTYRTVAAVTIEAPVRRSSSLGVSVPAQAGESARAVEHAAAESVVLAAQTAAPEASPAPIMLPTAPAEARVSPDAKLTFGDLIARSFEQMTKHYRAVLLRTLATFALAGALLALPTVVWIASFLAERYVDLSGYPWLSGLLASTFYIQLIAPMVLVPFGLMFLVCGVLCVLGAIEGSEWSRWGSLFAWRRRFLPMMILGYVAAGTEVASFLLTAFLFDPKASNTNIIESTLSRCIEACPIVLCLLAGMLVMTTESTRGVFGRVGRALKWASARLLESRASTLPALGTVLLIAVLCAILILPLPFLGLPVFFVAIGLGFRTFEPPVEA
ncbi:MAG: hypothetical protein RIT24_860, partial [Planctomycetota bacterium]